MKYKILAGSLTAHPNTAGTHLDNYVKNKHQIAKDICEALILHDQIYIPIQDYLTACGLVSILGENNTISLLESDQIRFVRARHQLIFVKSRHLPGEIGLMTAQEGHPSSSPHNRSIALGLDVLENIIPLKNRKSLERLLAQQTDSVNIDDYLKDIKKTARSIFRRTPVASKPMNDFLGELPDGRAQVNMLRVSPLDINNPIQVMIGLASIYYETNLLKKYNCSSNSSAVDWNNLSGLTAPGTSSSAENLWSITELYKIPDLGEVLLSDGSYCKKIIKITRSSDAAQFRQWFHDNENLSTKEIQQEFVALTDKEPWFKTPVGSYLCWGIPIMVGFVIGPLAGIPLSLANKLLGKVKGQSPKYFISSLCKITPQKKV